MKPEGNIYLQLLDIFTVAQRLPVNVTIVGSIYTHQFVDQVNLLDIIYNFASHMISKINGKRRKKLDYVSFVFAEK